MRDDVFVYVTEDLPDAIHSACVPCADGYNIYINAKLDEAHRQIAYLHELFHIDKGHLENDVDVDAVESKMGG